MTAVPPESTLVLTVAAVVERNGLFMFVEERIDGRLVLNQPAGHVDPGETLQVAVIRETLEESAFTLVPEAVLGVYLWGREGAGLRYLRVTFCGRLTAHDPHRTLDEGIERVLWLPRAEILAGTWQLRSPMVLRAVDDYMSGVRQPIDRYAAMTRDELLLEARRL